MNEPCYIRYGMKVAISEITKAANKSMYGDPAAIFLSIAHIVWKTFGENLVQTFISLVCNVTDEYCVLVSHTELFQPE